MLSYFAIFQLNNNTYTENNYNKMRQTINQQRNQSVTSQPNEQTLQQTKEPNRTHIKTERYNIKTGLVFLRHILQVAVFSKGNKFDIEHS